MSSLFDDLARTLAKPMPRGRALRTMAAALAIGAIPALRPGGATAGRSQTVPCPGQGSCPSPTKRCCVTIPFGTHESGCYYPDYARCCTGPNNDAVHPNLTSWTCPKYANCGTYGAGGEICTCSGPKCRDGSCCPRSKGRCVNGACCPAIRTTRAASGRGVACCPTGTIAVPGARALCCRKGDLDCCDKYDPRKGDDDLSPLGPGKGRLCINGRIRKAK